MPKRFRTMGPAAEQAPDEANEVRRKRLRMALTVEQAVEEATGLMNEVIRKRFRSKLLAYYEQESAKTREKEQGQHRVSLGSATLTRKEISETLKGLVVMLNSQKKQDQSETSPEPDRVSGDVDDVDMVEETTADGDGDMNQYEDEVEDDDDDDEEEGYSDRSMSDNEEANTPENECISSSPWSVEDSSTPKNPFLEDSPQVDLMGPFHNELNNRNRANRAVDPFLRDPVSQSLRGEADYENYHKRPRITFNSSGWRL